MSFFRKAVGELAYEDLAELLSDGATETSRLEFKRKTPGRAELLKKVSAFANTYGGDLIIGAEEDGAGALESLPGVGPEEQQGLRQKIVQWCMDGVTPPIHPFVSQIMPIPDHPEGHGLVVVRVEESGESPHFINGRKGCYIRTDEFSGRFEPQLADEREIQHLLARRARAIERRRALQERSQARYRTLRTGHESGSIQGKPFLQVWIGPQFPVAPLTETRDLEQLVRDAWGQNGHRWTSMGFLQHESLIRPFDGHWFKMSEVTTWGTYFHTVELDYQQDGETCIHLTHVAGEILGSLRDAEAYMRALGYDGSTISTVRLSGFRGIPLKLPTIGYRIGDDPRSRLDDSVELEAIAARHELVDEAAGPFNELAEALGFAFGWSRAADAGELEKLASAAKVYASR